MRRNLDKIRDYGAKLRLRHPYYDQNRNRNSPENQKLPLMFFAQNF
jgi:hypothetical protein